MKNPTLQLFLAAAAVALLNSPARADSFVPAIEGVVKTARSYELVKFREIPYPVKLAHECSFTDRELRLISDTFVNLPLKFRSLETEFYFEKKCRAETDADDHTSEVVAKTYSNKILLSDLAFSIRKPDGRLYALNETFTKKVIAHELMHVLDRELGLSKSSSFRQINHWSRTLSNAALFPVYDEALAEGFYRDQGMKSPKEDLATSAEGYFFDADFICRLPAKYAWFQASLGPSFQEPSRCPELEAPIRPGHVTSVGYVLVSATQSAIESRFGHSALHFHDDDRDPLNDIIVQAGAYAEGAPVITGFETPEELAKIQAQDFKVNRTDFLMKGATGRLDSIITPTAYRLKWLETIILEGRDISERILELSPLHIRLLAYIVNRDIKHYSGKYKFLSNNCATYVAEALNKALGGRVIDTNSIGIMSPVSIFEQVEEFTKQDLGTIEGDLTRLNRKLAERKAIIRQFKKDPRFGGIQWKLLPSIIKPAKAKAVYDELEKLTWAIVDQLDSFSVEELSRLRTLLFTYTLETQIGLKLGAQELYIQVYRMELMKKEERR